MKRHIMIGVSACVFAVSTAARVFGWKSGARSRPYLTILYYHSLPEAQVASFRRQMWLLASWARVVPAQWQGGQPDHTSPQHPYFVAITFDDAFESVLDNAIPILAKHGFACTIFVPSGCLGQPPSWAMESNADRTERVADGDRLSRLPSNIVSLGSHTVTHPHLTMLSGEAVRRELAQSMRDVTALAGKNVEILAFPYGDHDARILNFCRSAGYKHVFTIQPGPVFPKAGEFARGRVAVDPGDGLLEFFLKFTGSYQWMPIASAVKHRLTSSLSARRGPEMPGI